MADSSYTVGDMVAEFLSRIGVTTAFGIVSVHNVPMLDAIGRRNAIPYVMARGEMGGAHMADAYARVTGGLGVVFTSTGPGMANSIGGLVEARFAGSPVLHIRSSTRPSRPMIRRDSAWRRTRISAASRCFGRMTAAGWKCGSARVAPGFPHRLCRARWW